MQQSLYGGIELGGTKTICAVADRQGVLSAHTTIPTTSVDETLDAALRFFEHSPAIRSLGVGSFGPIQLDPALDHYGFIYNSPKPGWSSVNIKNLFEEQLKVAVAIDTDVNCAALGEQHFGVAKNVQNFIYITLGTGIGGSFISNGNLVYGVLNLEMGHMRIPHEPFSGTFNGACLYHGDCFEGIASGHAMSERYGKRAETITDNGAWDVEAGYISAALNNLMMTLGPELIVVGGGLVNHDGLMESIRIQVQRIINNYMDFPNLEHYIVTSSSDMNGVLGAIKLASLVP